MRKIGLSRPGRLGHGPKKVSPPCVPGDPSRRVSGVYSDSGLPPDSFNSSFDSFTSEVLGAASSEHGGAYPSYPSEGSLYGATRGGPSPPCRPDSLYVPRPALNERPEVNEQLFKEPYVPYRSSSTVSTPSQEQSPTKGSRNSMSSIDSGWASNPVPGFSSFCSRASNSSLNSDKTSFSNEEVETRPVVHHQHPHPSQRRMSTISNGGSSGPPPPKRQSSTSSFTGSSQHTPRNSMRPASSQESVGSGHQQVQGRAPPAAPSSNSRYSSNSSLGSSRNGEDVICTLNLRQMIEQGVHPEEVVHCWLTDLRFQEYFSLFAAAGYDMPTISRMTPEDLTAIGVKKPHHRKKLTSEIAKLDVPDGLPVHLPQTIEELMSGLRLGGYLGALRSQGYQSVQDALSISIEDLEDIGFYQLGHQKRLLLGLRRVKDLKSGKKASRTETVPYQPEEVTMATVAPLASLPPAQASQQLQSSRQSFSSFHQAPGHQDSHSQLRFPPHPDHPQHRSPNTSFSFGPGCPPQPSPPPPEMPSPMAPLNHSIPGIHHHLPPPLSPLPHPEPLYQQFYQLEPTSPVWGLPTSPTVMQTTVQVHPRPEANQSVFSTNESSSGCGTLPRPTATVHPLPTPMEHDASHNDVHMPFANERSGTIKLKTSPTEAYARLAAAEEKTKEGGNSSLLATPSRAGNRTAGDVMEDISTMLADLTDELDSMLCSDSVPQ